MTIRDISPSIGAISISPTADLVDTDTAARIALACARVSGNPTIAIGMDAVGGPAQLVAAVHDGVDAAIPLSAATRMRIRTMATARNVARALETARRHGLGILAPAHELWPTQLKALRFRAPLVLWTRGDAAVLQNPSIALTGTNAPSGYGIHMTIELGTALAERGWTVAASTAGGVDQLALRAAEAMKRPGLAVTAASLETSTAPTRGVIVTETAPGCAVSVDAQRRAKQVLAALTAKTVAVEPAPQNGAALTVHAGLVIGRPVGIVPAAGSEFTDHDRAVLGKNRLPVVSNIRDVERLY